MPIRNFRPGCAPTTRPVRFVGHSATIGACVGSSHDLASARLSGAMSASPDSTRAGRSQCAVWACVVRWTAARVAGRPFARGATGSDCTRPRPAMKNRVGLENDFGEMPIEPISVPLSPVTLTVSGFAFPGGLRLRFLAGRVSLTRTLVLNALFLRKNQSFSLRFRKLRNLLCKIQTVASVSGLGRHL